MEDCANRCKRRRQVILFFQGVGVFLTDEVIQVTPGNNLRGVAQLLLTRGGGVDAALGLLLPLTRRDAPNDWTFFSMASIQPIYVVLAPPGQAQNPVPFALAGLPAEHREALRDLRRGDRVPPEIVAGLLALAPRSVLRQQLGVGHR
jgi:hypothetical protein